MAECHMCGKDDGSSRILDKIFFRKDVKSNT